MRMIKAGLFYMMLLSCVYGYEILVPNYKSQNGHTFVAYSGADIQSIEKQALGKLNKKNMYANQKFNTSYVKDLDNIETTRYWIMNVIKSIKMVITVKGLKGKVLDQGILKGLSSSEIKEELAKVGIDLVSVSKMTLDEFGIQPKSTLVQFLTTAIIDSLTGKTPVDLLLDSAEITTNLVAIKEVNKALYYSLSATIATSYSEYKLKYILYTRRNKLFGREYLSLKEFISSHP